MSLATLPALCGVLRFPRVSGDEPGYDDWTITGTSFSPRERG